jgi:hypothetical protein
MSLLSSNSKFRKFVANILKMGPFYLMDKNINNFEDFENSHRKTQNLWKLAYWLCFSNLPVCHLKYLSIFAFAFKSNFDFTVESYFFSIFLENHCSIVIQFSFPFCLHNFHGKQLPTSVYVTEFQVDLNNIDVGTFNCYK